MSRTALVDTTIASDGLPKVEVAEVSAGANRCGVVIRQWTVSRRAEA